MNVSIMIPTRNRRKDLQRTLKQIAKMKPEPFEVIVCADGCTDGTVEMICEKFRFVTLIINTPGVGSVASRDKMLRTAKGEWVLCLDDDSYPVSPTFLNSIVPIIEAHPEVAVFRFPELRDGNKFAGKNLTPDSEPCYVAAYPNCAALMDREFYLRQPGFSVFFTHMYEETDYACQCYSAGKAIRFEPSLTIRHHLSDVQRQAIPRHHQNARNELWSVWLRCPWGLLPFVTLFRAIRQFNFAQKQGTSFIIREPLWWLASCRGIWLCVRNRKPVSHRRYLAWMKLAKFPIHSLAQLNSHFAL